jgi:hypothetical protein
LKLNKAASALFGIVLLSGNNAFSQTTEKLEAYKAKYPGEHVVQVTDSRIIRIKLVKDKPVVTSSYVVEYLVLDNTGTHLLSEESIEFSSFETVQNIEAYTMVPSGKSSKKVPATNFFTRDSDGGGGVFHDDMRETTFMYPGIVEGGLRHLAYDEVMSNESFPFGFYFYSGISSENPTFTVEVDTAIHVNFKTYNTENVGLVYSEKLEKGKHIYTWTCPKALKVETEEFAPNPRYFAPQVLGQIAYYNKKKGGRTQVIENIRDLHSNYEKNVKEVEEETPEGSLAAIADSLTKDLTNEFDKVKAIYYWVQDNIKYIAFEEGEEGFVPRQPSKVVEKRYGDCKDMASLTYSMLKAVGIKSYLTWIGSRDLPYKYSEFPSSFCDNHMIATYKYEGKNYYLDATNSFQSIEYPTSFIQGKEALVHLGPNEFEIANVPVVPAHEVAYRDSSFVKIQDNKILGHTSVTNTGYYNTLLGGNLKEVKVKEYKDMFGSIYERGNNSFLVSNPKVVNGSNRDKPIVATFDWSANNYVTKVDNELYVNMILYKELVMTGAFKKERVSPFEYEQKFDDVYYVELTIPEGYSVKSMPKNQEFKSDIINFSVTYQLKGDKLICNTHFKSDFLLLYPEKFDEWNKFIAVKKAALSESLVLIKK